MTTTDRPQHVGKSIWDLFTSFFLIGAFTIGGGYAMIPLIKREVVTRKKWLDEQEFLNGIAVSQSLPGPIAVNIAVFTGYRISGLAGAISAVVGAVLPAFVIIVFIAGTLYQYHQNAIWISIFKGIRPAVVALVLMAFIDIIRMTKLKLIQYWMPVLVFIAIVFFHVSPMIAIVVMAVYGLTFLRG